MAIAELYNDNPATFPRCDYSGMAEDVCKAVATAQRPYLLPKLSILNSSPTLKTESQAVTAGAGQGLVDTTGCADPATTLIGVADSAQFGDAKLGDHLTLIPAVATHRVVPPTSSTAPSGTATTTSAGVVDDATVGLDASFRMIVIGEAEVSQRLDAAAVRRLD